MSESHDHNHDHDHSPEEIKKHLKRYYIIGVALALGTLLTVWANFLDFGSPTINIVVALIIASVKGFLVVAFFMHLISEKKMIYSILVFTVFFFAALMYLTLWSMHPANIIQTHFN